MKTAMETEIKKVVERVKDAQTKLQTLLKSQDWVEEARKYAERQGKEVKKLLSSDLSRVKTFLEREGKSLEKIQKQIPGEVKKIRTFVQGQRKELEKLLTNVRKASANGKGKKSSGAKKKKSSSASKSKAASSEHTTTA